MGGGVGSVTLMLGLVLVVGLVWVVVLVLWH